MTKESCTPVAICNEILRVTDHLKQRNTHVVITLLEPRQYNSNNRFNINPNTYNKVSRAINRRLTSILKKRDIRTINLSAKSFAQGHVSDGVHFTAVTKSFITSKIKNCIEHHKNKLH